MANLSNFWGWHMFSKKNAIPHDSKWPFWDGLSDLFKGLGDLQLRESPGSNFFFPRGSFDWARKGTVTTPNQGKDYTHTHTWYLPS